jgi:hypothetical protein
MIYLGKKNYTFSSKKPHFILKSFLNRLKIPFFVSNYATSK